MRRRIALAAAAMLVLVPVGAQAAPTSSSAERPAHGPTGVPGGRTAAAPAAHADRDHDGLSEALERRLDAAEAAGAADRNAPLDVIVTWDGPVDVAAARQAVGPFAVRDRFTIIPGVAARVTPGQARALARIPSVARVDEDFEVTITMDEADVDYGTAAARVDFGVTGAGVNACVLDTGIDAGHEQLDDGKVLGFLDVVNGRTAPYDDHDHGTHVSAILAGDGQGASADAARYGGVAPGAGLYGAKVLDSAGSGPSSGIITGIEWCVQQPGVRLLSMSLGTAAGSDGQDPLSLAVDAAVVDHDVVVAVAAGNSGDGIETVGSPGAAAHALTIGASGKMADGLHLAPFSSRGPTVDGRRKPDVAAPGVAITSADANTTSGYFAASGTSMATPFAAGTVALALAADPALDPAGVRALVESTATDLGFDGPDDHWGAGLLDGYGVVAGAAGATPPPATLPQHEHLAGVVPDGGSVAHSIDVAADQAGSPLAVTLLIDGQEVCALGFGSFCFAYEWSPDLDARLTTPDGSVVTSRCPLEGRCGSMGQQETFVVAAAQVGTYVLEVYPFADSPNNGTGGPWVADVFFGPSGAAPPPPPPPPPPPDNTAPVAGGDAYATSEDIPLVVGAPGVLGNDTDDDDGDTLTAAVVTGPADGTLALAADGSFTYTPDTDWFGTDTFTYAARDGNGGEDQATVTVAVAAVNDPPTADAGPDVTVTDEDRDGSESVSLNGSASTDVEGLVTWTWRAADGTLLATGATPHVDLPVGVHDVTLTVTDTDGATATDDVQVVVEAREPPNAGVHVGDLDGVSVNLKGDWRADVTVTIHDEQDDPVKGATVAFARTAGGTTTCTTHESGRCVVSSPAVRKKVGSVTFTVTDVSLEGETYQSGDNHDPDGDSNGTTIVVSK